MKRKAFDLRAWPRVTAHTQTALRVPGLVFVDYVAHTVIRPLDVRLPGAEGLVRILDSGYRWVRAHPTGGGEGIPGSALTVQLDAQGRPVQFYVDLHGGEGVQGDGLPWHDDLYLDVIGHPSTPDPWTVDAVEIIDGDELEEAVAQGLVTPEVAAHTWKRARQIEIALMDGTYPPLAALRRYVDGGWQKADGPELTADG